MMDEEIIITLRPPPYYNAVQRRCWRARVGLREKKCDLFSPLTRLRRERWTGGDNTFRPSYYRGETQRVLYDHGNLPCAAAVTVVKREFTSQTTFSSTCMALT